MDANAIDLGTVLQQKADRNKPAVKNNVYAS